MTKPLPPLTWDYDRTETIADGVVHALGVLFAIAGAGALVALAVQSGSITRVTAVAIYLAGLVAMIGLSAAYNMWPVSPRKWWLRRFDHAAIYLLIAATYTAFILPLRAAEPNALLAVIWLAALGGAALKLFLPQRLDRTAIALYLIMGWSGLFALGPIAAALTPATITLIFAGGALYSLGVIFHAWRGLRFQNAIWHGFVLAAAACHYAAVAATVG
jgi:hemolysin III